LNCVLTSGGYTKIADLKIGDLVYSPDGELVPIISILLKDEEIFLIKFSDGTDIKCSANNFLHTITSLERDYHKIGKPRTILEIQNSLIYNHKKNHSIPITLPIKLPKNDLIIFPYSFGLLLGDGSFRNHLTFSSSDQFIINMLSEEIKSIGLQIKYIDRYDYKIIGIFRVRKGKNIISSLNSEIQRTYNTISDVIEDGYYDKEIYNSIYSGKTYRKLNWQFGKENLSSRFVDYLKSNNLWNKHSHEKFIPNDFKYSSINDRIELLQGLMDTDGSVDSKIGKNFEFCTTSRQLAEDVIWLVQSLGGIPKCKERITKFTYKGEKKNGKPSFRIRISAPNDLKLFKLPRKLNLVQERTKYKPIRYIVDVINLGKCSSKGIIIDSKEHLYLTNNCIVTYDFSGINF
jgi:intein/homing endonuclease